MVREKAASLIDARRADEKSGPWRKTRTLISAVSFAIKDFQNEIVLRRPIFLGEPQGLVH